jgi:hypothetical protein
VCDIIATALRQTIKIGPSMSTPFRLSTEGLVLRKSRASMNAFRCFFAEGKIGGTPCMRSHILVQRATTKYSSISFICKNKIEKEGLPKDSPAGLGAGGPRFESGRPDQNYLPHFVQFIKKVLHPYLHLWNSRRQEVWSCKPLNSHHFAAR